MRVLRTLVAGAALATSAWGPRLTAPGLAGGVSRWPATPPAAVVVQASARLRTLQAALLGGDSQALPRFWEELSTAGAPLVERIDDAPAYRLVTIFWRATTPTRGVSVKFSGSSQLTWTDRVRDTAMRQLLATDLWYVSYRLRADTRVCYQIAADDPLTRMTADPPADWAARLSAFAADPLNPHRFEDRSVLELSEAPPQPWVEPRPDVRHGDVQAYTLRSARLGNERQVWVYLPASGARAVRNLIVVPDGESYPGSMALPTTLDNLTAAGKLAPSAAVMIGNVPGRRVDELHYADDFAHFVAGEVVPWVKRTFGLTVPASRTAIVGSSVAGSAAAFIALRHPAVFGVAVSMSGGFANRRVNEPERMTRQRLAGELLEDGFPEGEWLTREVTRLPRVPVVFALVAGVFEDITEHWQAPAPLFAHPSLLVATRHFRDVLEARGYVVYYHEYNGAHEVLNWRGELGSALIAVMPSLGRRQAAGDMATRRR